MENNTSASKPSSHVAGCGVCVCLGVGFGVLVECVCMCVCVYVCVWLCVYVCVCVCLSVLLYLVWHFPQPIIIRLLQRMMQMDESVSGVTS